MTPWKRYSNIIVAYILKQMKAEVLRGKIFEGKLLDWCSALANSWNSQAKLRNAQLPYNYKYKYRKQHKYKSQNVIWIKIKIGLQRNAHLLYNPAIFNLAFCWLHTSDLLEHYHPLRFFVGIQNIYESVKYAFVENISICQQILCPQCFLENYQKEWNTANFEH